MFGRTSKSVRCAVLILVVLSCFFIVFMQKQFHSAQKINEWIQSPKSAGFPSMHWTSTFWSSGDVASNASDYRVQSKGALLIPSDQELEKMNEQQMAELYWKYINTIQVLCRNQTRLGSFKDGGKEICVDDAYLPRKPCIVYSFGSNFQFDFEQAVINAFGCEVYTFDPTMNLNQKGKTVPGNVHFQLKGLEGHDHKTARGWEMRTLQTIMKELGHENETIDILKIDIEGGEWNALTHMFKVGTLQRAKQLSIEIHYGPQNPGKSNWGGVNSRDQLKVLRGLYNEGFLIFMREHNLYSLRPFKSQYNTMYTNVNEISLINVRYLKK